MSINYHAPKGRISRRAFLGGAAAIAAFSGKGISAELASNSLNTSQIANLGLRQDISEEQYWRAVRQSIMLSPDVVFLNDGSYGTPPRPVFDALIRYNRITTEKPGDQGKIARICENEVRPKLARFVGAHPDEIALTHNTTEGMSIAAAGIPLSKGDEILTTNHEHPGGIDPWRLRAARNGIAIKEIPIPSPPKNPEVLLNLFNDAITTRTKVISFCHMTCTAGLIFPAKEICKLARDKGIISVVDGAHPLGMFDFDLHDIDPDVYANSPHKWLGAPLGNGFFYVKKEMIGNIWPMHGSGGWDRDTARRFECFGTRDWAVTACIGDAIDWQNAIGLDRITKRGRDLMTYFKQEVQEIKDVKLWTSMDPRMSCSLAGISIREIPNRKIYRYIFDKHRVLGRLVDYDLNAVRFSAHYFNTYEEMDIALKALREIAESNILEA